MRKAATPPAWTQSAEFRAIARQQCAKMNAAHAQKPRCSAIAKSTGVQCTQPAMANGKCRFHGGKTPCGDQWHRVQWPAGSAPDAIEKLNRKFLTLEKRARERKRRLARKSPEALAAYQAWLAARKPGPSAKRAAARERRRWAVAAAVDLSTPTREPSPEVQAIQQQIADLEAEIAAMDEAETIYHAREGVFA